MTEAVIHDVRGFQIFDSRGWPTLAVEVILTSGDTGLAMVPVGASTGSREARELRDGGALFKGRGLTQAVHVIDEIIRPRLLGIDVIEPEWVDRLLIQLDGTENKARLGANVILGVSLAVARAIAQSQRLPLYRYWAGSERPLVLPTPQFNVINGGAHADNGMPIQEFLIIPGGASSFFEAMKMATEVYHALSARLRKAGYRTAVGDEGGFAPEITAVTQVFDLLLHSIDDAGLMAGKDVGLGVDVAASSFYDGRYYDWEGEHLTAQAMTQLYDNWLRQYPLVSLEDGLAENDWEGWVILTRNLGERCQIVGDDVFVTQLPYIRRGIAEHCANAALIKLNQVGTVTETRDAVYLAHQSGWNTVISHRSGETTDTSLVDFAVALGSSQVKAGAPARGERVAKYNRLLLMEAHDPRLSYAGWSWRKASWGS